jgi:hypothetical protein
VRLFGTSDIVGSSFTNNSAVNGGDAIISHGTTALTNDTIANNTALDGGGTQRDARRPRHDVAHDHRRVAVELEEAAAECAFVMRSVE